MTRWHQLARILWKTTEPIGAVFLNTLDEDQQKVIDRSDVAGVEPILPNLWVLNGIDSGAGASMVPSHLCRKSRHPSSTGATYRTDTGEDVLDDGGRVVQGRPLSYTELLLVHVGVGSPTPVAWRGKKWRVLDAR